MKKVLCFLLGLIVILFSTPLAHLSINLVYSSKNLTSEYIPLLNGFIHSYIIIGILIFSIGLISMLRDKNLKDY
ncbi:glycosyl transferase [Cytobacillus praedii]|uniref:Glycosyl transferase n=1 Tax=Cytobacillus praedii TaxID=1742358 RepID=A0A4R1AZD4_9BACI|nr:glycosyl transferase [Cytobacillus praedii]